MLYYNLLNDSLRQWMQAVPLLLQWLPLVFWKQHHMTVLNINNSNSNWTCQTNLFIKMLTGGWRHVSTRSVFMVNFLQPTILMLAFRGWHLFARFKLWKVIQTEQYTGSLFKCKHVSVTSLFTWLSLRAVILWNEAHHKVSTTVLGEDAVWIWWVSLFRFNSWKLFILPFVSMWLL